MSIGNLRAECGIPSADSRSYFQAIAGDGTRLLFVVGISLILAGGFAIFLGVTRQFLPHDEQFLGMTARDLCGLHGCRFVHFMIHDRISFGGVLIAIGLCYLWLTEFPLRQGHAWAWWLFLLSGFVGFGSFLAYLGYGYLDSWHGLATLALLPCHILGLARSYSGLQSSPDIGCLLRADQPLSFRSRHALGRACLLFATGGLTVGGFAIFLIGATCVFVPQDITYLGLSIDEMHALNPRLVPLIAHDRAGFGGGVCVCGLVMFFCVWCGGLSRSLWQVLFLASGIGFTAAIGVHPAVGYNDVVHLAPAVGGAALFLTGLLLSWPPCESSVKRGQLKSEAFTPTGPQRGYIR